MGHNMITKQIYSVFVVDGRNAVLVAYTTGKSCLQAQYQRSNPPLAQDDIRR